MEVNGHHKLKFFKISFFRVQLKKESNAGLEQHEGDFWVNYPFKLKCNMHAAQASKLERPKTWFKKSN